MQVGSSPTTSRWTSSSTPTTCSGGLPTPARSRSSSPGPETASGRRGYIPGMPINNVSHIAIGVRDMESALPFWTGVVGPHVSLDTEEQFTIGGEVIRRRGVYLRELEGPNEPFVVLDEQL